MEVQAIIGAAVRHVIGLVGGGFIANGIATASQLEIISGGIAAAIAVGWSFYQKKRAA